MRKKPKRNVMYTHIYLHLILLASQPSLGLSLLNYFFHSILLTHNLLQPLSYILLKSSSTSPILLFLGLPLILLHIGFQFVILFVAMLSSICLMWPSHSNLLLLMNQKIYTYYHIKQLNMGSVIALCKEVRPSNVCEWRRKQWTSETAAVYSWQEHALLAMWIPSINM